MPTYEYECTACGHAFEKFQPITSKPIKKCPVCGKSKVKRLIGTGAGLIFKGSGFYITDYRSESYDKSAKADSAPATTDAKPAGDSKPAADAKPSSDPKTSGKDAPAAAPAKAEAKAETKPAAKPPAPPQAKSSSARKSKR